MKKNLRIASESEEVFARILDEFFRCFNLPEISVLSGQTIQKFMTLTPSLYFEITFSSKKMFLMVTVNVKIYERTYFKRDHVIMCEYLYYMYIYI